MNVVVDATSFTDLTRRYHRELQVHCYRMLGSFDAAENHVQEVFLRAWRSREAFEERSSARTWLYRIATNTCLDTLRRTTPPLQPYPDQLCAQACGRLDRQRQQAGAGASRLKLSRPRALHRPKR
jgi:RNA polymerase sigma-70 factor (ECF subfamily)